MMRNVLATPRFVSLSPVQKRDGINSFPTVSLSGFRAKNALGLEACSFAEGVENTVGTKSKGGLFLRNSLITLLLFIALTCIALADEASLQFEQANQLYRSGEFQKAAAMYEQIVKNGYSNADVYFNLGNAYFKLQNIPSAVLNFERAKRIAPHDDDVNYNLRLANLRVVDKIDPLPTLFLMDWWKSFINLASADGWALLTVCSVWGLMLAAMIFLLVRSQLLRRVLMLFGFIAFVSALLSFAGVIQRNQIETSAREAIEFAPTASIKSAPDPQSVDLFVIHEGVKVEVLDTVGDWRKIRLADGKIGWITGESLQVI